MAKNENKRILFACFRSINRSIARIIKAIMAGIIRKPAPGRYNATAILINIHIKMGATNKFVASLF